MLKKNGNRWWGCRKIYIRGSPWGRSKKLPTHKKRASSKTLKVRATITGGASCGSTVVWGRDEYTEGSRGLRKAGNRTPADDFLAKKGRKGGSTWGGRGRALGPPRGERKEKNEKPGGLGRPKKRWPTSRKNPRDQFGRVQEIAKKGPGTNKIKPGKTSRNPPAIMKPKGIEKKRKGDRKTEKRALGTIRGNGKRHGGVGHLPGRKLNDIALKNRIKRKEHSPKGFGWRA